MFLHFRKVLTIFFFSFSTINNSLENSVAQASLVCSCSSLCEWESQINSRGPAGPDSVPHTGHRTALGSHDPRSLGASFLMSVLRHRAQLLKHPCVCLCCKSHPVDQCTLPTRKAWQGLHADRATFPGHSLRMVYEDSLVTKLCVS